MSFIQKVAQSIDSLLAALSALAAWLAIPIVLALFLQWPLRDLARCCSREANDLGQWLFALYIAVAVVAATRARTHLSSDTFSRQFSTATRRKLAIGAALLVALPFSVLLLSLAWTPVLNSVRLFETFGDTGNPGYFLVKASVLLLAALMGLQAFVEVIYKGYGKTDA